MKRMIQNYLEGQFGTGDPEMLNGFFNEYRTHMTEGIEILKQLLDSGNTAALVKKSHALKGVALMIGDEDLSVVLLKLERAALHDTPEACRKLIPELEKGLALLQDVAE